MWAAWRAQVRQSHGVQGCTAAGHAAPGWNGKCQEIRGCSSTCDYSDQIQACAWCAPLLCRFGPAFIPILTDEKGALPRPGAVACVGHAFSNHCRPHGCTCHVPHIVSTARSSSFVDDCSRLPLDRQRAHARPSGDRRGMCPGGPASLSQPPWIRAMDTCPAPEVRSSSSGTRDAAASHCIAQCCHDWNIGWARSCGLAAIKQLCIRLCKQEEHPR